MSKPPACSLVSEESGESLECPDVPCAWGVVDMQGWRKTMEDHHTAVTDLSLPQPLKGDGDGAATASPPLADGKVFGVFDGHGGPKLHGFISCIWCQCCNNSRTG